MQVCSFLVSLIFAPVFYLTNNQITLSKVIYLASVIDKQFQNYLQNVSYSVHAANSLHLLTLDNFSCKKASVGSLPKIL